MSSITSRKTGYSGTQEQSRREVERALRAAILHTAKNACMPASGISIRLFNNNLRSSWLIDNLRLRRKSKCCNTSNGPPKSLMSRWNF